MKGNERDRKREKERRETEGEKREKVPFRQEGKRGIV